MPMLRPVLVFLCLCLLSLASVVAKAQVTLSPLTLPQGSVGTPYSAQLLANDPVGAYSFSVAAGALPAGITLNPASGLLSGTPTAGGVFNVSLAVTDSSGGAQETATVSYALVVTAPTVFISPSTLVAGVTTVPYSRQISAGGGTAPYEYRVSAGSLPPGISLSGSGMMGGTPTTSGNYNFTITAEDSSTGSGPFSGSRAYAMAVVQATPPTATVVVADTLLTAGETSLTTITFSEQVTGFDNSDLSVANASLSALSSVDGGMSWTATLTPTSDMSDPTNTIVVNMAGLIDLSGVAGTGTATSNNYAIDTLARVLAIADVSQSEGNSGTTSFIFTVTLNAASVGTTTVNYTTADGTASAATDYVASSGTLTFSAGESSQPINLVVNADTAVEADETFFVNLSAPVGATLGDSQGQGTISNDDVLPAPIANDVTLVVAALSSSNPVTLNITGGAPTSVAVAQAPAHGTIMASGLSMTYTPTAGYYGGDSFTYTATNATGTSAPATVSVTIQAPTITILPATLPGTTVGVAYLQTISASGGTGPYGPFMISAGALPPGLSLASNGTLSGTASAGGSFNFTVLARDGNGFPGTRPYTLAVAAPTVVLPPTALPGAATGQPYVAALNPATGGTAPYAYAVTAGSLPTGITLASNGALSGTASVAGNFAFTVTATDSSSGAGPYAGTRNFSILATTAPISNAVAISVAANSGPTAVPLAITGGTPDSVAIAGAPTNGSAVVNGLGISYTPTPGYSGADSFTYTATNAAGTSAPATVSVSIVAPSITLTPASLPGATVGAAFLQAITASGGTAPYSFSVVAGSLPAGTSLASNGSLSGTPSAGGSFNFTVRATDADGFPGSISYGWTVAAPTLVLPPTSLPGASTGQPYAAALNPATGGTAPYAYAVTAGSLPTGITLAGNGALSGTASVAGNFTFTVTATDSSTGTGPYAVTQDYSILSTAAPIANPAALGVAYNSGPTAVPLDITGGTPDSVAIGSAPTHGSAVVNGLGISYQPSPGYVGADSFTYTATNVGGTSAPATVTVTVLAPTIVITPAVLPGAVAGTPFAQQLSASGASTPYVFTVAAGTLPAGITLSTSGLLSGTPGAAGTFNLTVAATDAYGQAGTLAYAWMLTPPTLALAPAALPAGMQHVPYAGAQFVASGGQAPYQYTISGGALPAGLVLNANGALSGTATVAGNFPITVTATDSTPGVAATVSANYVLAIDALPDPTADPDVRGAIEAQIASTRRFADAQLGNFQRRLESLHENRGRPGFDNQISLTLGSGGVCPDAAAIGAACAQGSGSARLAGAGGADNSTALLHGWAGGSVRSGDLDGADGGAGTEFETDGISLGFDQHIGEHWAIGAGLGYGKDVSRIGDDGTRNDGRAVTAALYSSYHPGSTLFIDSLLGYQNLSYDLVRSVGASGKIVTGARDGSQWFASVTAGGDYSSGAYRWSPYARWTVARAHLDAYEESGDAVFGLAYDRLRVDSNTLGLGWRGSVDYATTWGRLSPRLRVEYLHDFQDAQAAGLRYISLPGSPDYSVLVGGFDRNRWSYGLGAALDVRAWTLSFEWQGTADDAGDSHGFQVHAETTF